MLAVDHDGRVTVEDDVEPGPAETLSQNALSFVEPFLVEGMSYGLQLRARQIAEQRETSEGVGDLISVQFVSLP
jgi:hypothetical protein